MMNKDMFFRLTVLLSLLFVFSDLRAQNAHFLEKGRVFYEKKVNNHARLQASKSKSSMNNAFIDEMLKNSPQFRTSYFQLDFDQKKSLYQEDENKKSESSGMMFFMGGSSKMMVYKNLEDNQIVQQKSFIGEDLLIQDTIPTITWRITDEYRDIAGFSCRRANGLILDSVYVVAFYSDQITLSGGPESFGGLPGTILGVAIPELNTTWFATKVEYLEKTVPLVAPAPKRVKSYTRKTFLDTFRKNENIRFGSNTEFLDILI